MKKTERYVLEEIGQVKEPNRKFPASLGFFAIGVVGLILIVLIVGITPRITREEELKEQQKAAVEHKPVVFISPVRAADPKQELLLPANIEAIQQISVYARSSGYLKERLVDIGDHVKTNQLMMVIATPETDKQLQQAKADVRQAQNSLKAAEADLNQSVSALENAKASAKKIAADLIYSKAQVLRYSVLANQGAVSVEQRDLIQHNVDADKANLEASNAAIRTAENQISAFRERINVAQSNVESKQATVEQIQQLVGFQKVLAPCDGVITARNVDAGALVTAGSTGQNTELLRLARTDTLRVFVYVPQSFFQNVHPGDGADILVSEMPGEVFKATIVHVAGALDAQSRTLQIEVHIPNKDGRLLPGMYAQVKLSSGRVQIPALIPSNAIVTRNNGTFVGLVDKEHKLHYQKVLIGRDFGPEIEITTGLHKGQMVVLDPSDDIKDGDVVDPKPKEKD